jgi:hypothetical protein
MSDREKSNPPTAPVPPELQGRQPDPPVERKPAGEPYPYPDLPPGATSEAVVLRRTFAVQILPEDARALEQTGQRMEDSAREVHDHCVDYVTAIEAAADDLLAVAEYLDWYADGRGDGVERHELRLAAAALDAAEAVARVGRELKAEAVTAAAGVKP